MKKNYLKRLYSINQLATRRRSQDSASSAAEQTPQNPMLASIEQQRMLNNQYSEYLLTGPPLHNGMLNDQFRRTHGAGIVPLASLRGSSKK